MSDLAIELEGVGKAYPFFTLDNIHLEVPHGQIMGLIGPNGAGKSTTIRILLGLVHQDCGEVRVLGHRMPAQQVAAKWDIGFASEDSARWAATMVAVAPTLVARSQRSRSVRAMMPPQGSENIDNLVNITRSHHGPAGLLSELSAPRFTPEDP